MLHPEIEGFSITAGNSSGTNDAAAAVALVDSDYADGREARRDGDREGVGVGGRRAARLPASAPCKVIGKVLDRAGLKPSDIALWEINEAFASVPIAACKEYGIDEELVNFSGSGCSLGHPDRRIRCPHGHHAGLRTAAPWRRHRCRGDVRGRRPGRRRRHRGLDALGVRVLRRGVSGLAALAGGLATALDQARGVVEDAVEAVLEVVRRRTRRCGGPSR